MHVALYVGGLLEGSNGSVGAARLTPALVLARGYHPRHILYMGYLLLLQLFLIANLTYLLLVGPSMTLTILLCVLLELR